MLQNGLKNATFSAQTPPFIHYGLDFTTFPAHNKILCLTGRLLRCPPYYSDMQRLNICLHLQSLAEFVTLCLIARLAKECKHILLVTLYTRLVERIYTKHICAYSTAHFEEVE